MSYTFKLSNTLPVKRGKIRLFKVFLKGKKSSTTIVKMPNLYYHVLVWSEDYGRVLYLSKKVFDCQEKAARVSFAIKEEEKNIKYDGQYFVSGPKDLPWPLHKFLKEHRNHRLALCETVQIRLGG